MVGYNGKPKISRELIERMSSQTGGGPKSSISGLGTGSRSLISDHKLQARGRRHVAGYQKSILGQQTATVSTRPTGYQSPDTAQTPGATRPPSSVRPQLGFREPPARDCNPYS